MWKFIKEQKPRMLSIGLVIKTPFSKIPLVSPSLSIDVLDDRNNTQVSISRR